MKLIAFFMAICLIFKTKSHIFVLSKSQPMQKIISCAALLLCGLSVGYSQDTTNIDRYFDKNIDRYFDKSDKYAKNLFKIGLSPLLNGEINMYYERIFFKHLGIEVGAGLSLPFRLVSAWTLVGIPQPMMGGNAQAFLKFRPFGANPSHPVYPLFLGGGAKQTWFTTLEGEYWVIRDYIVNIGGSRTVSPRWSIEASVGWGMSILLPQSHINVTHSSPRYNKVISSLLPCTIKICHHF